jgi:hypothetical protein
MENNEEKLTLWQWIVKNDNLVVNTIAVLGVVLATWGFMVAYKLSGVDYNFLNSFYSTVRLFGFDLDAPDLKADLIWQLEISRWMITFFIFYFVGKGIILIAHTKWELFKLSWSNGGHVIICGAGEKGKTLGLDWLKKYPNKRIFFIEPDSNNENIETLKENGAIVIQGKAEEETILKKLKVSQADYFVITTDNDATNIEIASKLISFVEDRNDKLKCYIHVLNNEFYDFFSAKGFSNSKNIDIKIFNVYSNSARMLFGDDNHLLGSNVFKTREDLKDKNKKVKIAVFGFGKLGESILIHALNLGHFFNEVPLEVTVVFDTDKNENANILDEFNKQYDILEHNGHYWNVEFIDDGEFKQRKIEEYSQIVIAYENEFESLSNLMKLLKMNNDKILEHNIDISIYSNSYDNSASIIESDNPQKAKENTVFQQVRTFGELSKTCNYDMVINEELDKKAEINDEYYNKLHNYYASIPNKELQEYEGGLWGQGLDYHEVIKKVVAKAKDMNVELDFKAFANLNMFKKDSNRYLIEHNEIKKYMINILLESSTTKNDYQAIKNEIYKEYFNYDGMEINWDEMGLEGHDYAIKLTKEEIVTFGKLEHTRWNAFHILNGWKTYEIPQNCNKKIEQDKIKKLHPCIVSWDELDIVSKNHNHDYKSDDIETVMRIPSLDKKIEA